jgi:Domain of unknown function (DUF4360)
MKLSVVLLSLLMASAVAKADTLQIGEPAYGGTGCPAGSASVSLSPDQTQISMLFDSYVVQAGNGVAFDRKNCNIAVPVHVPSGYSVAIFGIDYRGFTGLPAGGRASLSVDYFLASGGRGVHTSKTFMGPSANDYLKHDDIGVASMVWTACGADTILRANTSMLVQSNAASQQAMATVDSADINAGLIYQLQWRRCP